jgi:hypothetical protein
VESSRTEVREAVAASAAKMPPEVSDELLSALLSDADVAVRKLAIKSTSERNNKAIREQIGQITTTDTDDALRRIAGEHRESIAEARSSTARAE